MSKFHIILISSVLPEPSSAGQVLLHRHFVGRENIDLQIFGSEPVRLTASSLIRRIVGKLGQTSLRRFATDFSVLWQGRWLDPLLQEQAVVQDGTIVVTVAHGDAYMAAMRFAKKHSLPLVTFFHDWWPDMIPAHAYFRERVEREFLELHGASSLSLSVSEGMKDALGKHPNSRVFFPMPSPQGEDAQQFSPREDRPFRILYFGSLGEYGPMLQQALDALQSEPSIQLEVRGVNPAWPVEFQKQMKDCGSWLGFVPRDQFEDWLATADAFLISQAFDPDLQRLMETNFPSKLPESTKFGKPIVIWGPEYGSAICWGRKNDQALCVSDENPEALVGALKVLADSPEKARHLGLAACAAFTSEFHPTQIQNELMEELDLLRGER